MLEELRLRGLGLIDDATLDLSGGFTVVTGETGAGKTMLLSALLLLLGARADAGMVRAGYPRAEVEGRFRIDPDGPVARRVLDAGGALDDGALLVARTVSAEGRSKAFVGGRAVPLSVLSDIADGLVAVHGQADQRGLLRPAVQRQVLDSFGGPATAAALARYRTLFSRLSTVQAQLLEVTSRKRERAQEADLLRFGLDEVQAVDPKPGEDETLRRELDRLAHADELRRAGESARGVLNRDADPDARDVLAQLADARQALESVRGRDDGLDALTTRLAEISYLTSDVAADLAAYVNALGADPARLDAAQHRWAELTRLTRKFGPDINAVLEWAAQSRDRLAQLDHDDDRVTALASDHAQLLDDLGDAAAELSLHRTEAAHRLAAATTVELGGLSMSHATIEVAVRQREDPHGLLLPHGRRVAFGASGVDDVEFLLVPHPGAAARPLHKGASGGELSRVMLALEVVLAGDDLVPTFVFDEVDAGVGGRTAVTLGERLADLARSAQVLVVTHLPQVAAFADHHFVVRKDVDAASTVTSVTAVEGGARVDELARMLAGLPESATGQTHAVELLAVAAATKQVGLPTP